MHLGNGNLIFGFMSAVRTFFWEAEVVQNKPYSFIRTNLEFYFFLSERTFFWEAPVPCKLANH